MKIVLPKTQFNKILSELAQFPLCYKRYESLNVQWEDCTIEARLFEPEQPGFQGEIPEITYEDRLPTTSMAYERDDFGNSNDAVADYGEYLYSLLEALATYNPVLSGKTTLSLGSANDYQRGRD